MATVGPIAKAVEAIFSWVTDEDGLNEMLKRRKLANLKKECADALARNDFVALADAVERLRVASAKP